ncbi:MAG: nucleoside 2-deoxyribosyltransferase [Bacteroidetes bacterium]|jgi:hypothetical protein|nr:nucleoside 2-deoxyribosyltransferase [Bacteroidota bacterium]
MISKSKICLIGDVVVDITLKTSEEGIKLRLGGIIHAARCLWALNIEFDVGYFAPSYLDESIEKYLKSLGCNEILKLGTVNGAPYVFLINEAKEVGDQGYEFILRDDIKLEYYSSAIDKLGSNNYDDLLFISGNYEFDIIKSKTTKSRIHIDVANNLTDLSLFKDLTNKLSTLFISTSSELFRNLYKNDFMGFKDHFTDITERLILKENRGGSRAFDFETNELVSVPAQTRPIVHSVGVGDVYNASYICHYPMLTYESALNISSWVAMEYATTTYPDDFKTGVKRILKSNIDELVCMGGVNLPWESRKQINIYIAAPDFDFINTAPIELLVESLKYHNFSPRRPIKENGQMEKDASSTRKRELFTNDIRLLDQCKMLIAVLLYNDPGTLIEIGFAAARSKPVMVYDPYKIAENCMLTELPILVSSDLDEIISQVFIINSYDK